MHIHHKIKPEHQNLKGILIEIGTIVFAVLFALGVENLWEHHKTMESVDTSKEKINKEVAENLMEITLDMKKSQDRQSKLTAIMNKITNDNPFMSYSAKFGGYNIALLNFSTWKRIINDKSTAYMPSDYMDDAYKLYYDFELLENFKNLILNFVYSDLFLNKSKAKEGLLFSEMFFTELINHYVETIKPCKEFLKKYDFDNYKQISAMCDSIAAAPLKQSVK